MTRTVRAAYLRPPRPSTASSSSSRSTKVVPIELLRREALLEEGHAPRRRPGGPRPPRGGLRPPGVLAGAAMVLRALWPVLVALVRVLRAAVAALAKWTAVVVIAAVLVPPLLVWQLSRRLWWVWIVLALLVLL